MQDYRRLRVWAKAHAVVLRVRSTTNRFPRNGYSSLKSQMTGSAESIAFNIVEGCGSSSQKEFARFLEISIKSTGELEYQLQLSTDYGVLAPEEYEALSVDAVEVRKMLYGLRAKVLGLESESESETDDFKTDNVKL